MADATGQPPPVTSVCSANAITFYVAHDMEEFGRYMFHVQNDNFFDLRIYIYICK